MDPTQLPPQVQDLLQIIGNEAANKALLQTELLATQRANQALQAQVAALSSKPAPDAG